MPSCRTPSTVSSPAVPRPVGHRTRAASCARRSPAETDRSREGSSRRVPLALELPQQRANLRGLERLAPIARVVEKAASGLGPEVVFGHLPLDEARRLEPIVAERLAHVAAGAIEDVHSAPIDELEDSD